MREIEGQFRAAQLLMKIEEAKVFIGPGFGDAMTMERPDSAEQMCREQTRYKHGQGSAFLLYISFEYL